jgi:hypothetical protein
MRRIVLLLSVGAIMLAMSVAPASAATFSNNSGIMINDAVPVGDRGLRAG